MRMNRMVALAAAAALALGLTACEDNGGGGKQKEAASQSKTYDRLAAGQPAQTLSYSPVRETMNFWIETWGEPGKLSYVYLQGANGEVLGYYVLEGLPVSYCAKLTPSYEIADRYEGDLVVPAPGMDGAYYTGSGSCDTYYGKDATTGAYIEYTAGLGINVLLYSEPLLNQRMEGLVPLGPTDIDDL